MHITFYEKPGCVNNTKQKKLLEEHGHTLTSYSLITEKWTPNTLRPFFVGQPLARWFNPSAPRIKSGEIIPTSFTEATALEAMAADPYLIRRPLMIINEQRICGFDHPLVDKLINKADISDLLACPKPSEPCD